MDEEIERLLVSVRADTNAFARDVSDMRGQLEGPLEAGMNRAGRALETALMRAVRTGKVGFEDLKRVALSVMAEIAAAAVRDGIGAVLGRMGGGGSISLMLGAMGGGVPGRAIGGPVAAHRPYWVGERGPELFVPSASGRIEPARAAAVRDIRMNITINAPPGTEPQALARSGRQVARVVRQALMRVDD